MLRLYCSTYIKDWEEYLPQVVGAYNSTQHSTMGISPSMMLTGQERAMSLTFFYPEYEGQKTSPQAYMRETIKKQQEPKYLCSRNTNQAQMRQRKNYNEKILRPKSYTEGKTCLVVSERHPAIRNKEILEKMGRPLHDTKGSPARSILTLEQGTSRAPWKSEVSFLVTGGLACFSKHGRAGVLDSGAGMRDERKRHQREKQWQRDLKQGWDREDKSLLI